MSDWVYRHAFPLGLFVFAFHMTFLFLRKIWKAEWMEKPLVNDLYNAPVILRSLALALFTLYFIQSKPNRLVVMYIILLNTVVFGYTGFHYYQRFKQHRYPMYIILNALLLIPYCYVMCLLFNVLGRDL